MPKAARKGDRGRHDKEDLIAVQGSPDVFINGQPAVRVGDIYQSKPHPASSGSANHNERSMWHDSEDMLAFRNSDQYNLVGGMRKELMDTVLSGDLPPTFDGKTIFEWFGNVHAQYNDTHPTMPKSLVYPLEVAAAVGSGIIS